MQGLAIDFNDPRGPKIALDRVRSDLECDLQNSVVNIMTAQGSDAAAPLRGTKLRAAVYSGAVVSGQAARHVANFAALATLSFMRTQTPAPAFSSLRLKPVDFVDRRMTLDITLLDEEGNPKLFSTTFQ